MSAIEPPVVIMSWVSKLSFTSIGTDAGPKKEDAQEAGEAEQRKKKTKARPWEFVRLAGRVYHFIPASGSEHDRVQAS